MRQIRKKTWLCVLPLLLLILLHGAGRAEGEQNLHTTTVMVYMCGSDLESRFGSASKDLSEMLQSRFDAEHTNVLVMVGGSKNWKLGFDAEKTAIVEIGGHGMRTVWQSAEPLNMAESATLSTFLDYVYSNYESERYALVLWDHGGGPNEGACYDELFPGQTLTLPNLKEALKNSRAADWGKELDWIGFDACLMANVETCYFLTDYARFMIASQEQEPSTGWNYAFLKGLETDGSVEETGRRIIDSYFEGAGEAGDDLTLSCVDLSKLWQLRNTMNEFFDGLYPTLSDETYSELSRQRHQSKSFGRAEYNASADYDLVDLLALTEAYESDSVSGEALKEALEEIVVYSRSTEEGAHGLSVYHPCFNRETYTSTWADSYEDMFAPMARNYVQYVKRFGRILTGTQLGDWSGLNTLRNVGADGEVSFSVTLSEEQAANFEHATLMILRQVYTTNGGLDTSFFEVWETPYLELDENRTLSAAYPNKSVYVVEDGTGKMLGGPINFRVKQDGKLMTYVLFFGDDGILSDNVLRALYYCEYDEETGEITVDQVCAYDEVTGEYSTRMTLDEEYFRESDFTEAEFYILERVPAGKGEELLGFNEWPSGDSFVYIPVDLPRNWHFEVIEDEAELETVYAFFQITDTQNLTHSSSLCQVFPDLVEDYEIGEVGRAEDGGMTLDVTAQYFRGEDAVCVQINFVNAPKQVYVFQTEDMTLNDTVRINTVRGFTTEEPMTMTFTRDSTLGLTEIRSLDFELVTELADYSECGREHIRLELPVPIVLDREGVEPLASGKSADGLIWTIWDVRQKDNGVFLIQYDVFNGSRKTEKIDMDCVALENYGAKSYRYLTLEPGIKVIDNLSVSPRVSDSDESWSTIAVISEPLAELGIESIGQLRLFYKDETESYTGIPYEVSFELREPCLCERLLPGRPMLDREILADGDVRLRIGQCKLYHDPKYDKDALSLGIWLYNNSGENHQYVFDCFAVDGQRVLNRTWTKIDEFDIPAQTVRFVYLQIEMPKGVSKPSEISFAVFVDEEYLCDVSADLGGLY